MPNGNEYKFCANERCERYGEPVRVEAPFCPTCGMEQFAVEDGVELQEEMLLGEGAILGDEALIEQLESWSVPITHCPRCETPTLEELDPPPCHNCKSNSL